MKELHKLDEYNIETLKSLIENKIEESINIDYKGGGSLQKTPNKKKELAKDVSAMANADGGIILYGVNEVNHVPTDFSFVDGNKFTKESLEQILSSTIKRAILGLKIFPIRIDNDIRKTIYVIQIPESLDAPHMNNLDKRYYIRRNFESIQMEEYEVRQLYGRKVLGNLKVHHISVVPKPDDYNFKLAFRIAVLVKNVGEVMVKNYRLNVYMNNDFQNNVDWSYIGQGSNYNALTTLSNFKITNERPPKLFKGDMLPIVDFKIKDLTINEAYKFLVKHELGADIVHDHNEHSLEFDSSKLRMEFENKSGNFSFLNDWLREKP